MNRIVCEYVLHHPLNNVGFASPYLHVRLQYFSEYLKSSLLSFPLCEQKIVLRIYSLYCIHCLFVLGVFLAHYFQHSIVGNPFPSLSVASSSLSMTPAAATEAGGGDDRVAWQQKGSAGYGKKASSIRRLLWSIVMKILCLPKGSFSTRLSPLPGARHRTEWMTTSWKVLSECTSPSRVGPPSPLAGGPRWKGGMNREQGTELIF